MKIPLARFLVVALALGFVASARAEEKPVQADIEKGIRLLWAHPATGMQARTTVRFNSVQIGKTAPANAAQVIEGAPDGAEVTNALVDFTVLTHEPKIVRTVRRVRLFIVYKNQMDEWQTVSGAPRGADATGEEAPSED